MQPLVLSLCAGLVYQLRKNSFLTGAQDSHLERVMIPEAQEVNVVIVYMQLLVSSLSAGDCLVHRLRKSSLLTGAERVTIPEAAYIQLRRRPPEDEQG
jgi:hypothetical protein